MFTKKGRTIYTKWLTMPAIVIYTIFFIIPNCSSLFIAFTDWNLFYFNDMRFIGYENFVRLFSSDIFWIALKNTFFFAFVTVIAKNLLGFIMALMVTKATKYNSYLKLFKKSSLILHQ